MSAVLEKDIRIAIAHVYAMHARSYAGESASFVYDLVKELVRLCTPPPRGTREELQRIVRDRCEHVPIPDGCLRCAELVKALIAWADGRTGEATWCEHWTLETDGCWWHQISTTLHGVPVKQVARDHMRFCDRCGAPRPDDARRPT